MVENSINHRTTSRMNRCLQRFQRSTPLKSFRKPSFGENLPCSNTRQSRFGRTSKAVQNAFALSTTKPVGKSAESLTRTRKRDRIRNYIAHRRENKPNEALSYLAEPAILSIEKEEIRYSDDTEDGDDVYMVDCQSDSDSDDEPCFEDDFIIPPVTIPEMYQRQDRLGGVIVAGARVQFTYAGFKRQQTMVHKLEAVSEGNQHAVEKNCMLVGLHNEPIVIGAF